jgi:asparagine synthase (glutamine-hydrolysing)
MCGIVGILSLDGREPVDEGRLTRMRDVLTHRGPDEAGIWARDGVGLGHRRLSIVDVAGGQQPMSNEDGEVWVVFNGEIYNHVEIRDRLVAGGHRYSTRSDTETIVHLYEEEGDRSVERLHGMFAFALWDRTRRRLLLARDRLGIKPLYYALTSRELLFASEIKAIVAAGVRARLHREVLPELLATRFVAGVSTLFDGIYKLPPGHTLTWSAGEAPSSRRYWNIPAPGGESRPPMSFARHAARLRDELTAAVGRHLMSDVPLGLFLSGGIDSTALGAITARLVSEPVRTFAVGFDEDGANELPYARLAARHIGAEHRDVTVSTREYFDALPGLVYQEDEPIAFTSSVPLYFVSKLAQKHVKVVLTGEGADELFLGYNRYRVTRWNELLGRPYWALTPAGIRRRVRARIHALPAAWRRRAVRTFLALEPGPRSLFFENFAVFPDSLRRRVLRHDTRCSRDPYAAGLQGYGESSGGQLDRMSRADLQTYLHELLMKQDQMSMAASIESRVPFLDDVLIEHVSAIPSRFKLRGWRTKAVLRAAVRDLVPPEILSRRKMGFPVPIGRWLRGEFRPVLDEFVLGARTRDRGLFDRAAVRTIVDEHCGSAAEHGDRLWLLINFEIWSRIFCDGEEPAAVMRSVGNSRTSLSYASAVVENGRPLAVEHGRAPAHLPDSVGTVRTSLRRGADHRWT